MNLSKSILICSVLLMMLLPVSARADTYLVRPDGTGDVATIQDGIDAAGTGDTVLLAAGTFVGARNKNLDFLGKAITVTSESGSEMTVIDCEQDGRGFIFQNGEGNSSVLSGVTIMNGSVAGFGERGGAIYCTNSSPTISGNVLTMGTAYSGGGGIACDEASPVITNNRITFNLSGAFYADDGGGIWLDNSSPTITSNFISGNSGQKGGGIYCQFSTSPQITGNVIKGNGAVNEGGGIYVQMSSPVIDSNIIFGNSASYGGGVRVDNSSGTVVINNTLCENEADNCGGIVASGGVTVENTIIAFSTRGQGLLCAGGNPTVTCCLIYGNAGGDDLCGIDGGNNMSVDPEFCGAPGSNIYSLQADSPCAPAHSPTGALVGALGVECGTSDQQTHSWGGVKTLYR